MLHGISRPLRGVNLGVYAPVTVISEACATSNIAFRAYFGGEGVGQFGTLTVQAEPIDFSREVPRSKIVIHHGGLGTAMWAMVNGVAQWGCANDFEKSFYRDNSAKPMVDGTGL